MTPCLALLLSLVMAQADPVAADELSVLKAKIERLQQENAALHSEVVRLKNEKTDAGLEGQLDAFHDQALADAKTIMRLKNALKVLEARPPAPLVDSTGSGGKVVNDEPRPMRSIQARLEVVDAKMGFVVIAKGREDGVRPGFRFDIFREDLNGAGPVVRNSLGVGVVEKYLDTGETLSKIKIVEGDAAKMRPGDRAVAYRALLPPEERERPKADEVERPPGLYKITGRSGTLRNDGFIINYGSDDGAVQSDTMYVYKDSRLKAKLRLDQVHTRFCVANVIDGTQVQPPEIGDHVFTLELKKTVVGRVRINDGVRGILIDVGYVNHGVRSGDLFEVRRQGRKVGLLKVSTADKYHSYCRPAGDTQAGDIKLGDHVERITIK